MKTCMIKITDPLGLHAKTASMLVDEAAKYDSTIYAKYENRVINLKSIMGTIAAGIPTKAVVKVSADGLDEEDALKAIVAIFIKQEIGEPIEE